MKTRTWIFLGIVVGLMISAMEVSALRIARPQTFIEWNSNTFTQLNDTLLQLWNISNGLYQTDMISENPDGSRKGNAGELLGARFSDQNHLCQNIANVSGIQTEWMCVSDTGSSVSAHNLLSASHSDTIANSPIRGDLVVANSNPNWSRFAVGGSNTVLASNGTDPSWSGTPTVTNLTATGTVTGALVDISTADIRFSAFDCSTKASGGKLTTLSDGVVRCADDTGISDHNLLSSTHADTAASTVTRGDLIVGSSTPAWDDFAIGANNSVLRSDGTDPAWTTTPTVTSVTATSTVTGAVVDISTAGIRLSALDCSTKANGGTLTTSSDGIVRCEDDNQTANREFYFSAAALQPLEHSADSIAGLAKDTGNNVDVMVRNFDDTTDECVGGTFLVPSEMVTGTVVTFRTKWYDSSASACGAACEVVWDIRTIARAGGENFNTLLTTTTAGASSASTTQDVLTETTWTNTSGILGMDASDTVIFEVCRDANNASDDLVGDASMIDLTIEIPLP